MRGKRQLQSSLSRVFQTERDTLFLLEGLNSKQSSLNLSRNTFSVPACQIEDRDDDQYDLLHRPTFISLKMYNLSSKTRKPQLTQTSNKQDKQSRPKYINCLLFLLDNNFFLKLVMLSQLFLSLFIHLSEQLCDLMLTQA